MNYIYSFFTQENKPTVNQSNNWNNPEEQSMGNNWTVQQKTY